MFRRVLESSVPWKSFAVVVGAFIIGIAGFWLTSDTPRYSYLGHLCMTGIVREPGFDPWTGDPHGLTFRCTNDLPGLGDGGTHDVTEAPPVDIAGRRAIPVPVGTALALLFLGGLAVYNERRGGAFTTDAGPIPDGR